jgi:Fic family protein
MEIVELYGQAMQSLGRLDEVRTRIPSKQRFLDVYVTKEALLSSQIEGIDTTLTLVLEYKARQKLPENEDVEEVLNYVDAMNHALKLLRDEGLPIVSRVLRESHAVLLTGARGKQRVPGEFRKGAVRVGPLIPPPAHYVEDLIANLEKYINEDTATLPLIRAGIMHVQFETIHPFWDGNGRIGRLLIVLSLIHYGLLQEPILYPSYYFKKFRSEYYDRLDNVRTKGDWEGWIKYYLRGIRVSADDVWQRAWQIEELRQSCLSQIENMGRIRERAAKLLDRLFHHPIMTINDVAEVTGTTYNPAQQLVERFIELNILQVEGERQRDRSFTFKRYMDILEKD